MFEMPPKDGQETVSPEIVTLPANLDSKEQLFEAIAKRLRFPGYFGMNWDSLDECINDLSWIEAKRVYLVHSDVPLRSLRKELKTYLNILANLENEDHDPDLPELFVVFPEQFRTEIASFL